MSTAITSINDWFCLKSGKENFTILPARDHTFLFGKAQWRQDIEKRLKFSIVLKEPLRIVWWGDFGIGKTQRLQYMQFVIQRENSPFYPVAVTCRDLTTKSGFDALHYDLVNNIGFEEVHKLVISYKKKIDAGDPQALPFPRITTVVDVSNAMDRIGDANQQLANSAWTFLTGLALAKGELPLANVTKPKLDSSVEFAAVLECLAWVIRVETGKQLLYLIDQMETLTNVTNRDFENAWVETLRAVLDIRDLGIVCAVGALRQDVLPTIILRQELFSRFKQDNYLRLPAYEPETAADFLKDLLREWIDPKRRDTIVKKEGLQSISGYSPETYPFTEPAFDSFCAYLTTDPRDAKPREILERLNRVAATACLDGARIISKDELVKQGISA